MADKSVEPVIECRQLSKTFKDFWLRDRVQAVKGIDLQVEPGELLGLLGPNGAGKSTTIKMILGLLFPTSGEIRVLGEPPTAVRVKGQIGYLPEETYLYPFLTAGEILDYYGRLFGIPRGERRRRTEELLEMVGLAGARDRRVGEFSKGMQRRIGLAQALINNPRLVILDEPTSGLDPISTRQVKDLLLELKRSGKTIILSSHLLADVEEVCSRVAILYGGKIRRLGKVEDLLTLADCLLLRTQPLTEAAIEKIQEIVSLEGKKMLGIENPRQRLESLFLEIVEHARSHGETTAGAIRGGRVASFLQAPPVDMESEPQPRTEKELVGEAHGKDSV